jgi:ABC-type bacteriocin/lantibiotic exporter with double-glycine peptidase domain
VEASCIFAFIIDFIFSMHGSQSRNLKPRLFSIFFRLVSQEPKLFAMSIKDNIKIGRPSATFEEIVEAAKKSNAHDFIESFAEGKLYFIFVSVPNYLV